MKALKIFLLTITLSLFGISGCNIWDVDNLNSPGIGDIINSSGDLLNIAGDTYLIINNKLHSSDGVFYSLSTMADEMSCSWGSAGAYDMSSEPRTEWNNSPAYLYAGVNRETWKSVYFALSQANDILLYLEDPEIIIDAETTEMLKAWSYFIQGIAHGYIGAIFQKGYIADETCNPINPEIYSYAEVMTAATSYLDKAITSCAANTFTLPDGWISGSNPDNEDLGKLANFMAAKFIISAPRNALEAAFIDWEKVKLYSQNGLTEDFNIDFIDDWTNALMTYAQLPPWLRVDCRVINMMDTDYPSRWNADGTAPDPAIAVSDDARLLSDFEWNPAVPFRPERGYYHFSYYSYWRYPQYNSYESTVLPIYPLIENNLMLAEAYLRTGNKAAAIDILNTGSRTTRGGLPPIPGDAVEAEVSEAIFYERQIELFAHSCGTGFFDMRRRDYLQPGTLLHFPIPGDELLILDLPYYSLGGNIGIEGTDYSAATSGWPGWEVQNPY